METTPILEIITVDDIISIIAHNTQYYNDSCIINFKSINQFRETLRINGIRSELIYDDFVQFKYLYKQYNIIELSELTNFKINFTKESRHMFNNIYKSYKHLEIINNLWLKQYGRV